MDSSNDLRGRVAPAALALLGGLLVALSMPPWGYWPLALIGVGAFEMSVRSCTDRRSRAVRGAAFGAGWMFMGMGWMWFLTVPGYIAVGVLFSALHAGAAAVAPTGRWGVVGRPAAHTLAEIIRITVPAGGIPLATLGISQAAGPLLGVARLGGVILITWIVFQVGTSVVTLIVDRDLNRRHGAVALVATVLAVVVAGLAPSGHDLSIEPLTVAAVQGGGRQGTSALDVPSIEVTTVHLEATATIQPDARLDLVVWPENAIDVDDEPFAGSELQQRIAEQARRLGVPIAVGVTEDSEFSDDPRPDQFVNAQVIITPQGDVTSRYEKVRIVPFGEYVPMRGLLEALGAPLDRIASDALAGTGEAAIELPDGTPVGVMISWEVFFGNRGRAAADGALLLNPTNGASYTGTILQTQQVASSKLRAIETGRWIVQVSPTGFSAFVTADGEVLQRTDVSEQRVITADVDLRGGNTWYVRLGDRPWIVGVLALLVAAIATDRRARRRLR